MLRIDDRAMLTRHGHAGVGGQPTGVMTGSVPVPSANVDADAGEAVPGGTPAAHSFWLYFCGDYVFGGIFAAN
jgi:hypothetical protein